MIINGFAFIFEVTDKMPSVAYMYGSGLILAMAVFGATYFHRQIGLITLLFIGLICSRDIAEPNVSGQTVNENGLSYIDHWDISCRMTFALSIILFFAAIILKRRLKSKTKK